MNMAIQWPTTVNVCFYVLTTKERKSAFMVFISCAGCSGEYDELGVKISVLMAVTDNSEVLLLLVTCCAGYSGE